MYCQVLFSQLDYRIIRNFINKNTLNLHGTYICIFASYNIYLPIVYFQNIRKPNLTITTKLYNKYIYLHSKCYEKGQLFKNTNKTLNESRRQILKLISRSLSCPMRVLEAIPQNSRRSVNI